MYFSRFALCLMLFILTGCGTDLAPSDTDLSSVECGVTGPYACQNAPDFTVSDSLGNTVTLSSVLSSPTTSGIVMYFTMWCTTCTEEMQVIESIMPNYPNVKFFAVDYISSTVSQARYQEDNYRSEFSGSGFTVLADTNRSVTNRYNADMEVTIVIDATGVVRMNERFKSSRLNEVLKELP